MFKPMNLQNSVDKQHGAVYLLDNILDVVELMQDFLTIFWTFPLQFLEISCNGHMQDICIAGSMRTGHIQVVLLQK